jgi:iron(III) transport system permease protein
MGRGAKLILLATISFLLAFLVYPLLYVVREAFFPAGGFSTAFFAHSLANPIVRESIFNSFMLALTATALTALIAIPLSVLMVRYSFPGKGILSGLLLLPMIMPPFVGAIGMKQMLARFGSVNLLLMKAGVIAEPIDWLGTSAFWGVVIVEALHLYPIFFLNTSAALANIDPSLEDAALDLGASRPTVLRRITLPLMAPGTFAGAIIVFIWSLTDLGTPLIFEYRRVMAVQIFDRITDISGNPEGHALVLLTLVFTLICFLSAKQLAGSGSAAPSRGTTVSREKPLPLGKGIITATLLGTFVLFSSMPHIAVILSSCADKWFMTALPSAYTMKYYDGALGHPLTLPSIRNSLALSLASTGVDIILGSAIAWLISRCRFRGRGIIDAFAMLPMAVPGLVLAFGYLAGFSGTMIDARNNPFPLLIIAYSVRRLPYMVRTAHAGFMQVDESLEEAALCLGASRLKTFVRVTLPLISANIIAGAILAFSFAMLEVSDSLILALREQFFPITKTIYQLQGRIEDGVPLASALGAWSMVFLGIALLSAGSIIGRKMGQMFRMH